MKANKKQPKIQIKKEETEEESSKKQPKIKRCTSPSLYHFSKLKLRNKTKPITSISLYQTIHKTLYSHYSTPPLEYISLQLDNLLESKGTHKVAVFKDYMIMDYLDEFLKREYSSAESTERIPKFVNYYKNYLRFFCKPTFRDFDVNFIIQNYGEKCAEMYYNHNYVKNDKKKKKQQQQNEELKRIFSSTIKDNINNNSLTSVNITRDFNADGMIKGSGIYYKAIKHTQNSRDSTLQLTGWDISKQFNTNNENKNNNNRGRSNNNLCGDKKGEDDSIIDIVNRMNVSHRKYSNKKDMERDSITSLTKRSTGREDVKNMTDRIPSGDKGALSRLIESKYLSPDQIKDTLYKIKNNEIHLNNNSKLRGIHSIQINSSNKLNTETTPIMQKSKKDKENNHNISKGSHHSKKKTSITRNVASSLPQANSNDMGKIAIQMYSTHNNNNSRNNQSNQRGIKHSNSIVHQNNPPISSMTFSNSNINYQELTSRKTITNFQIKNIKSISRDKPLSRNRQLSDCLQMPSVTTKPIFSSFNYFDKQQQLLNTNRKNIGNDCYTSSMSKGVSSIVKKNGRFNSDPFQNNKLAVSTGKLKLGIPHNSNINGNPLTKRNNVPMESLIKMCRDKPLVRLGKR